jgi:hypothetical protein
MKGVLIALLLATVLAGGAFVLIRQQEARDLQKRQASSPEAKHLQESRMQLCHVKADHAVNTGAFEDDSPAGSAMWERAFKDCMAEQQRDPGR